MSEPRHHGLLAKFDCWEGFAEPGFRVNFLGVKTREHMAFLEGGPRISGQTKVGFVVTKLPAFDEEYFQWIDLVEAVTQARGQFIMIELGAGYGRWLVNAGIALRKTSGLPFRLIGVEAEPTHFQWMQEHFRDNEIEESCYELIQAAIDAEDTAVSLNSILRPLDKVDLIDIDVQGTEFRVLASAVDQLNEKVCRVHIGTHGPEIEAELRALFQQVRWECKSDYPSGSKKDTLWGTIKFEDGVQSWVNPNSRARITIRESIS